MAIEDILYDPGKNEVELVGYYGFSEYLSLDNFELVDANERELGTEMEYVIEYQKDIIHLILYPEGVLSDYWIA